MENELAKLIIKADKKLILPAINFVKSIAEIFKFSDKDLRDIELLVEEASLYVIENSFDPGEEGDFNLSIQKNPEGLMISVEDKGLPVDVELLEKSENSALGILLLRKIADEIQFLNLGQDGKRIEILKKFPYKAVPDFFSEDEKTKMLLKTLPASDTSNIEIRMMKSDEHELLNLSRCIYRSYGYSYANFPVYYPDKMKSLLDNGLIESCIAINNEGEIIGHLALELHSPDDKVGESGMAAVDPRYRGCKLFEKMKVYLCEHVKNSGRYGTYSMCVTVHPYTQKGNISLGAHETGILLGHKPGTVTFKKIHDEFLEQRQSHIIFYFRVNEEPLRTVYLPKEHADILTEIFKINKLNRTLLVPEKQEIDKIERIDSIISVSVRPEMGVAHIKVNEFGKDILKIIQFQLKELCLKKIDYICLELSLGNPISALLCNDFEKMGFFFAGIIPEYSNGDILFLQYLNNVSLDIQKIAVASEFGKKLMNYITNSEGFCRRIT